MLCPRFRASIAHLPFHTYRWPLTAPLTKRAAAMAVPQSIVWRLPTFPKSPILGLNNLPDSHKCDMYSVYVLIYLRGASLRSARCRERSKLRRIWPELAGADIYYRRARGGPFGRNCPLRYRFNAGEEKFISKRASRAPTRCCCVCRCL